MTDHPKLYVTFDDGDIRVSVADLLSTLSLDDKRALAQRLACESDVIAAVVDQLVTGYTEDASSGASNVLDEQRRRLVDVVGADVLKRVVREALQEVERAKRAAELADEEKDALLRAIRDFTRDCPQDLGCRSLASAVWKCRPAWRTLRRVVDADAVAFIERVAGEIEVVRQAKAAERAEKTLNEESPL